MILLKDEPNVLLVQLNAVPVVHLVHRVIQEVILPLPVAIQHSNDAHQRGLPRAGWTHDGDKLALVDFELDAPKHPASSRFGLIGLFDVYKSDHF